jgi:hypothetical protein
MSQAQAAPGCDLVGYVIEPKQLRELRDIIQGLYRGDYATFDRRRDIAYRLSLMRDTALCTPVRASDLKPTVSADTESSQHT